MNLKVNVPSFLSMLYTKFGYRTFTRLKCQQSTQNRRRRTVTDLDSNIEVTRPKKQFLSIFPGNELHNKNSYFSLVGSYKQILCMDNFCHF